MYLNQIKLFKNILTFVLGIQASICLAYLLMPLIPSVNPIITLLILAGANYGSFQYLMKKHFVGRPKAQAHVYGLFLAEFVGVIVFSGLHLVDVLDLDTSLLFSVSMAIVVDLVASTLHSGDKLFHFRRLPQTPFQYLASWLAAKRVNKYLLLALSALYSTFILAGWFPSTRSLQIIWWIWLINLIINLILLMLIRVNWDQDRLRNVLLRWSIADLILISTICLALHPWLSPYLQRPLELYGCIGITYIITNWMYRLYIHPNGMSYHQLLKANISPRLNEIVGLRETSEPNG